MKKISFMTAVIGSGVGPAWTDMPIALTQLWDEQYACEFLMDLTYMTHCRMKVSSKHGAPGSVAVVQYWTGSEWAYLDGGTGPSCALSTGSSLAVTESNFVEITLAAQTDVKLRAAGRGGDAIADPTIIVTFIACNQGGSGSNKLRDFVNFDRQRAYVTYTNLPAADQEFGSNSSAIVELTRVTVDLSEFTQCRYHENVAVAGSAGTEIVVQYTSNLMVPAWNDLVTVDADAIGLVDSGWQTITAAARQVVVLRRISRGGNGVADPQFGRSGMEVRNAMFNDDDEQINLWLDVACADTGFEQEPPPVVEEILTPAKNRILIDRSHREVNVVLARAISAQDTVQAKDWIYQARTFDEAPTEMNLNPTTENRGFIALQDNHLYYIMIAVIGKNVDNETESAMYLYSCLVRRGANAAATELLQSNLVDFYEDVAAWDAAMTVDTVNGRFAPVVTGESGKEIQWGAHFISFTEISNVEG